MHRATLDRLIWSYDHPDCTCRPGTVHLTHADTVGMSDRQLWTLSINKTKGCPVNARVADRALTQREVGL
jgi:hypothetical protein